MSTFSQRSFASGEIAPALYPRVDTARYTAGLRTCKNSVVLSHGGTANRSGTEYIDTTVYPDKRVRIVPFVYSDTETYMIVFGEKHIRVFLNGVEVLINGINIIGASQSNPAGVAFTDPHPYLAGALVYIEGVGGMTQLNERWYTVSLPGGGGVTDFDLLDINGVNVNSTAYSAYTSGGKVYGLQSTYLEADLQDLKFQQSEGLLTIVHPNYPPRELNRFSATVWTLSDIVFSQTYQAPNVDSVVRSTAGTVTWRYQVTGVLAETLEESIPGYGYSKNVTTATAANPCVITTSTAHGFATGDEVRVSKMQFASGAVPTDWYVITVLTATTFSIPYSSVGFGAFSFGNPCRVREPLVHDSVTRVGTNISPSLPITLTWTHDASFVEYNVYAEQSGLYGFLGVARPLSGATTVSYEDIGLTIQLSDSLPTERNIFNAADNYPSTVGMFQQRRFFASTVDQLETVWASAIGYLKKFTYHSPATDADSIEFTLAGKVSAKVQHLVDVGNLLILTSTGEWVAQGNSAGIITPSEINPKQFSYYGASSVTPIVIGNSCIFIQARGSIIRDLGFDYQVDGYRGNDLTVFSKHLFDGYTITDWAYQQVPNSIIWAVRDDGTVLGLTYVKDQEIIGWHQHDFGGVVENVCTIAEGEEDALYLVIKRTIDGSDVRYIERLTTRYLNESNVKESIFMDSALTYDGRNTTVTTMTISGGVTWDAYEAMTVTASAAFFSAGDVGNEIHYTDSDGIVLFRFRITGYTSTTVVTGNVDRLVPVASRSAATTSWTRAVDQATGLDHLEGEQVSVLGDGAVEASPNNPEYGTPLTVTGGSITLSKCYGLIQVGLPYISDIETLEIDTAQGETLADKSKFVGKVTLHVEKTRGVWVGPKPPTDDSVDPLENLTQVKIRNFEGYNETNDLVTGKISVAIRPEWNTNGRVFIRQVDPLPISVLAIAPAGLYPVKSGG